MNVKEKLMEKNIKFDGKWENREFTVIVKGNKYASFYNGFRYGKGKIEFDDKNFILTSTHARRIYFIWLPFVEEVKGEYTFTDDGIIVSNVEGRYSDFNGTWKCMNLTPAPTFERA